MNTIVFQLTLLFSDDSKESKQTKNNKKIKQKESPINTSV